MKSVKAICSAVVLALALSVSVFAGDVETPGRPMPPPQTSEAVGSTSEEICVSDYADILWALTSIF